MRTFKKINYKLSKYKGTVLINDSIVDEQEIKEICFKDYLEKLSSKIEIIGGNEDGRVK